MPNLSIYLPDPHYEFLKKLANKYLGGNASRVISVLLEKEMAKEKAKRRSKIALFAVDYGPNAFGCVERVYITKDGKYLVDYYYASEPPKGNPREGKRDPETRPIEKMVDNFYSVGGWFKDINVYVDYRLFYNPKHFDQEDRDAVKVALIKLVKEGYAELFEKGYVEYEVGNKNVLVLVS